MMTTHNPTHWIMPLLRLSTGQRIVVLNGMRTQAAARGMTDVVQRIDRALAHEGATRTLENQWAAVKSSGPYGGKVKAVDNVVDLTLTGIRDIAAGHARGLAPHDPLAAAAARVLTTIFPAGVAAVTTLPVVDQVAAVEAILRQLQGELAAEVSVLGLGTKVAKLAEVTVEYRAVIERGIDVEFARVREGRDRGHDYLRDILCMAVAAYADSDDAEHLAARAELIAPVLEQMEIQRARARARRRGVAIGELDAVEDTGGVEGDDEDDELDAPEGTEGIDDGGDEVLAEDAGDAAGDELDAPDGEAFGDPPSAGAF